MASSPLADLPGYKHETVPYKSSEHGDILVDVAYPDTTDKSDATVVLHFHGGFLILGDRYSFLPWWLVNLCVARNWIFVTPDYRLLPETTAQAATEDAFAAYTWVLTGLHTRIGRPVGSVLLAGSSAGGYLALVTAAQASLHRQPSALLLIYGMLDPAHARYTTPGPNIFGIPNVEAAPVLERYPVGNPGDKGPVYSRQVVEGNPIVSPRGQIISALHQEGLFADYITGVNGLGAKIASEGVAAIGERERNLFFPLHAPYMSKFPPTFLLHGKNDSGVPVELSVDAAETLKAAGVEVHTEFPDDAEHGFDVRSGNIDVEKDDESNPAVPILKKVVDFLDNVHKDGFYDPRATVKDTNLQKAIEDETELEQPELD